MKRLEQLVYSNRLSSASGFGNPESTPVCHDLWQPAVHDVRSVSHNVPLDARVSSTRSRFNEHLSHAHEPPRSKHTVKTAGHRLFQPIFGMRGAALSGLYLHLLGVTIRNSAVKTMIFTHYHHHWFNVRVSMLSTDWTVPPKIWEFVERMFYGPTPFLTPTLPTTNEGLILTIKFKIIIISVMKIITCPKCKNSTQYPLRTEKSEQYLIVIEHLERQSNIIVRLLQGLCCTTFWKTHRHQWLIMFHVYPASSDNNTV